jgi:CheY-like chemotaxis protein
MKKKLNCILLVDDNAADNHYHKFIINQMNITDSVQIAKNGLEALDYLQNRNENIPQLIFLDINMPKMNGWEFLQAYGSLDELQKTQIIIIMLSTSINPNDIKKAETIAEVMDFKVKPLTENMLSEIWEQHFNT